MEPATAYPFGESEATDSAEDVFYSIQESRDLELSAAFGGVNPYLSNWTARPHRIPFQRNISGYQFQSSDSTVPSLTAVHKSSHVHEHNTQQSAILDHCLGESTTGTESKQQPFNIDSQQPPSGGYDDNKYRVIHGYIHHADCDSEVPHVGNSTYHPTTDAEVDGFLIPRATTIQGAVQDTEHGLKPAEEFTSGTSCEVDQVPIGGAVFPVPSQGLSKCQPSPGGHTVTSHRPSGSDDIHRFMRKGDGRKATCLWQSEGYTCGFFSQVDLVKRHIKRMHYCLKPCACEYCGRSFFSNYALKLHRYSHTGEKPFICEFCGQGFASPSGKSHHRVYRHAYQIRREMARRGGRPFSGKSAPY